MTNPGESPRLTQEQAAAQLAVSLSLHKKIEQMHARPQRDFAQRCDELFQAPGVPKDVAEIELALNMIKSCALSPADSRQLLKEIRDTHE